MDFLDAYRARRSDSPYVEQIREARVVGTGTVIRPAEIHWHMVLDRYKGGSQRFLIRDPLVGEVLRATTTMAIAN